MRNATRTPESDRHPANAARRAQSAGRDAPNTEGAASSVERRTPTAARETTRAQGRRPNPPGRVHVLFRVAAGPRIGHGHLRRAEVLARALRWPATVSIRGAARVAGALTPVPDAGAGATLDGVAPDLLVLDDPHPVHGRTWVRAAARRHVPVVSLHDLGLARVASTLAIDGSIVSPAHGWPAERVLRGLDYAVIAAPSPGRPAGQVRRALVSLGGGPRPALTRAILAQLRERHPSVHWLVTHAAPEPREPGRQHVRPIVARRGLGPWFARVDVAIVGGGISLYEAVAAGVPTIAVPVVRAQRPTIRGFAARNLAIDGGGRSSTVAAIARRVADRFDALVADARWRRDVRRMGPRAIDGRGAKRVAAAIAAVSEAARHA